MPYLPDASDPTDPPGPAPTGTLVAEAVFADCTVRLRRSGEEWWVEVEREEGRSVIPLDPPLARVFAIVLARFEVDTTPTTLSTPLHTCNSG